MPAAVVGLSSGLYGLNRVLKFSGTEREDLRAGAGLGWPHPWKTWKRHSWLYVGYMKTIKKKSWYFVASLFFLLYILNNI